MLPVTVNASSNRSDINLVLTPDYFKSIEPKNKTQTQLKISPINLHTSFNVKIYGEVSEPPLSDSAIININVMENITGEISYVRDFISLNPECLELNELLIQAEQEVQNYNYGEAQALLDNAVNSCKYLISVKKIQTAETAKFSRFWAIIKNPYFKIIAILVLIGISLTISYIAYNRWKWY